VSGLGVLPRDWVGRPFRALRWGWGGPKALPWAAVGRAVGAGEAGGEKGEGARVARTPCAERDATLVGFESLRLVRRGWLERGCRPCRGGGFYFVRPVADATG